MSSLRNIKSARMVEIFNPDGSVTAYPSIHSAAKSLGLKGSGGSTVYVYIARGGGRLVDIRIPVEIVNGNGTRSTYRDINEAARILGISTMEVHTMISNGAARLGEPTREVLTKPVIRRKNLRKRCLVEILSESGTTTRVFGSIEEARKTFRVSNAKIYAMVAHDRARFVYREREGGKGGGGTAEREKGEEKKFYDTLEYQEKEEEKFYDALEYQEGEKGKKEERMLKPPKEFFKIISLMVRSIING